MIGCISCNDSQLEESISTMVYVAKAGRIINKPSKNYDERE